MPLQSPRLPAAARQPASRFATGLLGAALIMAFAVMPSVARHPAAIVISAPVLA